MTAGIGIYGDKSCPLLEQHIHCRNCAVYSSAATRLLDRYSFEQEHQELNAPQAHEEKVATCSLVIFRLGDEWLGLATRCLDEVAQMQSIHSLPHQRSRGFARCGQCARHIGAVPVADRTARAGPHCAWRNIAADHAAHADCGRSRWGGGSAGG